MTHSFEIRPLPKASPGVEAAAWFLTGADPRRWLEELTRCELANETTRVFLVPRSVTDNSPLGILVVPGSPRRAGAPEPQGMRCRRRAGFLYLPVDAELHPPATDAEISAACGGLVTFFHPTTGCTAFELADALPVCELLELPEERVEDWNMARMGTPGLAPFTGVQLLVEMTPEDLYGEGAKAIGTKPPTSLPPAPGEPPSSLPQRTWRQMRSASLHWLSSLLGQLPRDGAERTWVNSVTDWVSRHQSSTEGELEWQRNRELKRLMDLLERDPEAGLSFAIPLDGKPGRGTAPPQGRLGRRATDFSGASSRGGPVDSWNVSEDIHAALRKRYHELANLELSLGRFKRAAYIFATLLGNLPSAANALIQGGHFAEAAKVLELELNEPRRAAECYEQAGLLEDALRLLEPLQLWEETARIHLRMGHHEEAQRVYRRAAEDLERRHDFLGASRILQDHLKDLEGALQSRFRAWPISHQSWECLELAFGFLGEHGRHTEARERIHQLTRHPRFQEGHREPLYFLVTLARAYPDAELKAILRREAIHHGSRLLQRQPVASEELTPILSSLESLWPADVLFARDGRRYELRQRAILVNSKRRQRDQKPVRATGVGPTLQDQLHMRPNTTWHHVQYLSDAIMTIGTSKREIVCSFRTWAGLDETLVVEGTDEQVGFVQRFLLVANWRNIVRIESLVRPRPAEIPAEIHRFCSRHCHLVLLPGATPHLCLSMTASPDHFYLLISDERSGLSLYQYSPAGMLHGVVPIHAPNWVNGSDKTPTQLFPTRDGVLMLIDGILFSYERGQLQALQNLGEMQLAAASPPGTIPRIAWSQGTQILVTTPGTELCATYDLSFRPQFLLFLGGDRLLVSSSMEAMVLAIAENELTPVEQWEWPVGEIQFLFVLENPSRVGSVDRTGNACLWEFPARVFT